MSQYFPHTRKLAMAYAAVARLVGEAGAVERIKRNLELRSVVAFGQRKRVGRWLMAAQCAQAFGLPAICASMCFDRSINSSLSFQD
ncbi:hypothetical protein M2226_003674 [Bradyrhizobium elkanii]|uniref:hypothetical protein n=1 Tax=Bradyrhizobium elkanii TaxID=29448 RepID=UPI00222762D8|nr:hypothetical protein [Bradyrhizobium elkanii]MCW2124930.1 hypothetical protein [Bradyrhizobium elkanii]MCW2171676.1 hypothetical protein [Bradyrhizobium elkanii]